MKFRETYPPFRTEQLAPTILLPEAEQAFMHAASGLHFWHHAVHEIRSVTAQLGFTIGWFLRVQSAVQPAVGLHLLHHASQAIFAWTEPPSAIINPMAANIRVIYARPPP